MSFRDDQDALLARLGSLERELAAAEEQRSLLEREGAQLREEVERVRGLAEQHKRERDRLAALVQPSPPRRTARVLVFVGALSGAVAIAGLLLFIGRGASPPDAAPLVARRPPDAATAVSPDAAVPAVAPRAEDPARIAGRWSYRTRSNCGSVDGVGEIDWIWDAARQAYEEQGFVYWRDSRNLIRWWGHQRPAAEGRALEGELQNSLGDSVRASWKIEGEGPDRLSLTWTQTNGCVGEGSATRDQVRQMVGRLLTRLERGTPSSRVLALRALGRLGPRAVSAIPALARLLDGQGAEVRAEAAAALDRISR